MFSNARSSEINPLLGAITPQSIAAGSTVSTGWIPLALAIALQAIINTGVFGANATLNAKLQQATSSAGDGVKDIAGKAITPLVAAGGNNRQSIINLRSSDLDVDGGYAFVRLSITVGTAAVLASASLIASAVRYPASSGVAALSTIAEIVG